MTQEAINIRKIIDELNKASELYYNGKESFLSDKEFDLKLEELKILEQKNKIIYSNSPTVNVGAPVLTELNKIQIKDKPMLSLNKVHTAKEIIDFSDGYDLIASIKCDGLSVRLIYKDTDLVSANTRGNGYEGGDITEHIKYFLNVPLKIAKSGTYIIDGEAIIYDDDFSIVNKNNEFKNNRNTASGSLALLDMSIVKNRRLSFIAWDIIKGGNANEYHYNLEEAEELGFTVVPALALDCTKVEEEEINNINQTLLTEAKEKGIPCDGVVWKINDIQAGEEKGQTAHHFLNACAWKNYDEEYETRLNRISYDVSRNGVLTPVAVFDPIEIDKTVVSKASLHNISIMKEILGDTPYYGQIIWVIKSNQIIPQITRAIKKNYSEIVAAGGATVGLGGDFGVICPICGGFTEIITSESGVETLVCSNPECEGKLAQRLNHFCGKKGLDIKGISRATIEKLIDWEYVKEIKDIFNLNKYKKEWVNKDGFGEKSVSKILDSIEQGRNTRLDQFISAIGIPLVGIKVAKDITKYFDTWEDFRNAVGGDWTEFEGFGPEINSAINKFNYTEADEIAKLLNFIEIEKTKEDSKIAGMTFCVTGKLYNFKNRDALKTDIESKGGKVVGSISSKVNYLINNDVNSTSSKNKAAKAAGIPIITEDEYLHMVEKL